MIIVIVDIRWWYWSWWNRRWWLGRALMLSYFGKIKNCAIVVYIQITTGVGGYIYEISLHYMLQNMKNNCLFTMGVGGTGVGAGVGSGGGIGVCGAAPGNAQQNTSAANF
jgi:hypothetical protein